MRTTPPVYSFISFTSFNYKCATQYSGVPTTGSLYREEEVRYVNTSKISTDSYQCTHYLFMERRKEFQTLLYAVDYIAFHIEQVSYIFM